MMRQPRRGLRALASLFLLACGSESAAVVESDAAEVAGRAVEALEAPIEPAAPAKPALELAYSNVAFATLIEDLSEPDAEFFSDNYISNETSYLQIADQLEARGSEGGVYIGVGPEQNFSYLALTEPELAFIVDIRRDNMVLHLLYKAAFDLAEDRAAFLALITGREPPPASEAQATVESLFESVSQLPKSDESRRQALEALERRIESYGVELGAGDRRSLAVAHRAFYEGGVDIRFALKEESFRKYPSLRELMVQRSPTGRALGFLATEDSFVKVRRMQRENRIVPLVGNFAGDHTLPQLAKRLSSQGRVVRSFYVSNVEQYLMVDGLWWKWKRNVAALPIDGESFFIRCYFDQGRRHPQQMKDHRTTTVLQLMADFNEREKPYRSMLALATDRLVAHR